MTSIKDYESYINNNNNYKRFKLQEDITNYIRSKITYL